MSTATHTPTPFTFSREPAFGDFPKEHFAIFDAANATVVRTDYLTEASAAFIVKACNAHDELVLALRKLVALDEWMILVGGTEGPISQANIEEAARCRVPAIDAARAALAKAGAA